MMAPISLPRPGAILLAAAAGANVKRSLVEISSQTVIPGCLIHERMPPESVLSSFIRITPAAELHERCSLAARRQRAATVLALSSSCRRYPELSFIVHVVLALPIPLFMMQAASHSSSF